MAVGDHRYVLEADVHAPRYPAIILTAVLLIAGIGCLVGATQTAMKEGLIALPFFIVPTPFLYLSYWCFRALKYGNSLTVYSDRVRIACACPAFEVPLSDIEGFYIQGDEGSGLINLYLKSGERFVIPSGENTYETWLELKKLTKTEESSKQLERKVNKRIWIALAIGVLIYVAWYCFQKPTATSDSIPTSDTGMLEIISGSPWT